MQVLCAAAGVHSVGNCRAAVTVQIAVAVPPGVQPRHVHGRAIYAAEATLSVNVAPAPREPMRPELFRYSSFGVLHRGLVAPPRRAIVAPMHSRVAANNEEHLVPFRVKASSNQQAQGVECKSYNLDSYL